MSTFRSTLIGLAGVAAAACAAAQAQVPNLAGASYIGVQVGTGKVSLDCPANTPCSRVDASSVVRAGHRFDAAWAFEVTYSHIDADWGVLGANYSAEYTGFGVGAAYHLPVSNSVSLVARGGLASNELKLQPAVGLFGRDPGTLSTSSVKPYVGVALSWQFARHWSTSLNLDWTRADLREAPTGPKRAVSVQSAGVGLAFNF